MRTSFNIPDELVEEFDRIWREEGIDNRSRAVREAMQEYIERPFALGGVDVDRGFEARVHGTTHSGEPRYRLRRIGSVGSKSLQAQKPV